MKKPVIGLVPLYDRLKESYWMLPGYMKGIEEAGGIPVMMPLTDDKETILQMVDMFDGFLLTGGHDVSPEVYHEENRGKCEELCADRDSMEAILIDEVLKQDKAVLGICRGIQMLNSVLGGNLYQDLQDEYSSPLSHRMKAPYDRAYHQVSITEKSLLNDILNEKEIGVNSCHHQAIKNVAPSLKACAISEDGLVEGVYMPDKSFVLAVQWHPEFSYLKDYNSKKIFKAFVEAAKK